MIVASVSQRMTGLDSLLRFDIANSSRVLVLKFDSVVKQLAETAPEGLVNLPQGTVDLHLSNPPCQHKNN